MRLTHFVLVVVAVALVIVAALLLLDKINIGADWVDIVMAILCLALGIICFRESRKYG